MRRADLVRHQVCGDHLKIIMPDNLNYIQQSLRPLPKGLGDMPYDIAIFGNLGFIRTIDGKIKIRLIDIKKT